MSHTVVIDEEERPHGAGVWGGVKGHAGVCCMDALSQRMQGHRRACRGDWRHVGVHRGR